MIIAQTTAVERAQHGAGHGHVGRGGSKNLRATVAKHGKQPQAPRCDDARLQIAARYSEIAQHDNAQHGHAGTAKHAVEARRLATRRVNAAL